MTFSITEKPVTKASDASNPLETSIAIIDYSFNGPFAVLISYIAELHRTELRARVILLTSLFYTIANTTLPLLAWGLLTKDWTFFILGDTFGNIELLFR